MMQQLLSSPDPRPIPSMPPFLSLLFQLTRWVFLLRSFPLTRQKKKSCFEPILLTIPEQFSANIMVFPGRYDCRFSTFWLIAGHPLTELTITDGFEGISNTTVDFINKKGITVSNGCYKLCWISLILSVTSQIYNVNDHYLDDVWEITEVLNLFTKSEQNLQVLRWSCD